MTDYPSVRQMVLEDEAQKFEEDFREFIEKDKKETLIDRKELYDKLEAEYK